MSTRHEVIQKIARQQENWDKELDHFQEKMEGMDASSRLKLKDVIVDIRHKQESLRTLSNRLEFATGDSLEEIKDGIEIAWTILHTSVAEAREDFMSDI